MPESSTTVPYLAEILRTDRRDTARMNAANALGYIRANADIAVPALIDAIQDEDLSTRGNAILSLSKFGTEAEPAIPAIVAALDDSNSSTRDTKKASGTIG